MSTARSIELGSGDPIYIPVGWDQHVEAPTPLNLLINLVGNPARRDLGSPWDAAIPGMTALRQLPPVQRRSWRAMFDHYVFMTDGNPAAHLPKALRGILPRRCARGSRRAVITALQQQDRNAARAATPKERWLAGVAELQSVAR